MAWSRTGKYAPNCLEASDKVIMVVGTKSTSFLEAATGKRAFDSLNAASDTGVGLFKYPTAHVDGVFYLLYDTPRQSGLLAAFDAASGKVKWAINPGASDPGGVKSGLRYSRNYVAASGKTVYLGGQVREWGGKSSPEDVTPGYIRAFDATAGKKLWQVEGTDIDNVLVPASGSRLLAASVAAGRKTHRVQMIDAGKKGTRGWKVSIPHLLFEGTGRSLACYASGLFLFAGGAGDTLFAVDAATGSEQWRRTFKANSGDQVRIGGLFSSLDGTTVYVPVGSDLVALAVADGAARWVARLEGGDDTGRANMFQASLRLGDRGAECSADTVFATDTAKTLWAIDAATGRARWKYTDSGQPDTGFLWVVGGNRVFIASHLTLTAVGAHGR